MTASLHPLNGRSSHQTRGASNRLNRLGTLTYAGAGCHDPKQLRRHVGQFFRVLRAGLDGRPLPYVWVPEWHKSDHGLHAHFAVGQFVQRSLIESAWGRGFVHIKLIGDLPVGSSALEQARKAAGYLGKYVAKSFEDDRRVPGLHRYDCAQEFQPEIVPVWGRTREDAIAAASVHMGGALPATVWTSQHVDNWQGPPAVWMAWAA